jgi:molybdate transport system substrate-binding protein
MIQRLATFLILLAPSCIVGCGKGSAPVAETSHKALNVFAAASLTESFTEIGKKFESANPGASVQFNFAGSQQLRAQIESGAQADIFASANEKEMNTAKGESLVKPDTIHDFARNRLIIIYPNSNPAKIAGINDLANPGIKIDIADVSVPVGKYTEQMVDAMAGDPAYGLDFKKHFLANVVSREENVKSVLSKIRLGEADAGVVYVTDVSPDAANEVAILAVPERFNQIASYPIAVVASAAQPDLAAKFEDLVLSTDGQEILRGHNFIPIAADGH